MKMTDYLAVVAFAAKQVFAALHGEEETLIKLKARLDELTRATEEGYAR